MKTMRIGTTITDAAAICSGGEAVSDFDLFDEALRAAFAAHTFGAAANCRIVIRPHTFADWARGASAAAIRSVVSGHRR